MAYKDSEELKTDERYPLGDYSFRIERTSVPGSSNDKIEAICTKDGKNARKSIQVPSSTQLLGWYVEANETEATVYVVVKGKKSEITGVNEPLNTVQIHDGEIVVNPETGREYIWRIKGDSPYIAIDSIDMIAARTGPHVQNYDCRLEATWSTGSYYAFNISYSFTHEGQTVYYYHVTGANENWAYPGISQSARFGNTEHTAWAMVFGNDSDEVREKIVARFAIELEDAGGVGPEGGIGGGWTDPGDYDPDWEEGDPTHTLYVTVTGALSGRHNDPIVDPSYSYIPADKDTVKDYGCGGDGGNGGGGGAGASTVVIHKFATNQANSKEVTAIAKRHGYGSGGGKGGKGGDGCILVYY